MPDLNISQSQEYCEFCRKPLIPPVTSKHHDECFESLINFNNNEFSPFSEYQDFNLVRQFFSDLMADNANNKGLIFSDFLKNCCNWDNNGKLESLKIWGGFLTSIPSSLENFNLKELIIHNNRSVNLPEEFSNLNSLEHLELHFNSYYDQNYAIPTQIWSLKQLKNLILSGYFSLEGNYSLLDNLEYLSITAERQDKNVLVMPQELQHCSNLRSLRITSKYLNMDKFSFQGMNLDSLQLDNNNLNKLSDSIENLQSLVKIILSYNKFKDVPGKLQNLEHLKEIDLSVNMISKIPSFLDKIGSLEYLILTDNPLKNINPDEHHFTISY